jgi:hypothetical protein
MVGQARGQSIPSLCGRVNHHVVVLCGRFHVVDAGQEEPIAVIMDVIFDGFIFIGWRQEAEVAADRRPAGRRGWEKNSGNGSTSKQMNMPVNSGQKSF